MEPTDLTIEILKGIRQELNGVREESRRANEQLGELRDRQTATEVRLATELVGIAGAVREVRDLLREDRALSRTVQDHERRIAAIEARTG